MNVDEFAAQCIKRFLNSSELPKVPNDIVSFGKRDYDKEIKELETELEKCRDQRYFSDQVELQKKKVEEAMADAVKKNADLQGMIEALENWSCPPVIENFRQYMITELQAEYIDTRPIEAAYRHLNRILTLRDTDHHAFLIDHQKDIKRKMKVIEDTKHQKVQEEEELKNTQAWLDAFYGKFSSLVKKEEPKEEKKKVNGKN